MTLRPDARPGEPTSHRVLVTGGAGFIGSHLVDALLAAGVQVNVLDDLSTGSRDNLPLDPRVRLLVGDVADPTAAADALEGCDRVVHLAAIASVQRSVEDPVGTHRVNYGATLQLLEAARRAGVRRFLYASSAAVYGDVQPLPVTESGALDPGTPYAIDKRMGEMALDYYGRAHGMEWAALRFFNVFGPRQRADSPYSGVVSLFLRRVAAGEPLTVFGDGGQTRDFVFVRDVARVLAELLLREEPPTNAAINVASGTSVSVLQLADAVEAAVGTGVGRHSAPARSGEVRHSRADVGRLRDVLGWVPSTTLVRGLASCLDHDPVPAMVAAGTHVPGDPPKRP